MPFCSILIWIQTVILFHKQKVHLKIKWLNLANQINVARIRIIYYSNTADQILGHKPKFGSCVLECSGTENLCCFNVAVSLPAALCVAALQMRTTKDADPDLRHSQHVTRPSTIQLDTTAEPAGQQWQLHFIADWFLLKDTTSQF